jgi:hypothetical protein
MVPDYLKEEIELDTENLIKAEKMAEEKILNLNMKIYFEGVSKDI